MKVAYFDCFAGISGDMFLGALADLGLDITELEELIKKMGVDGFSITSEKTIRKGISCTDVKVSTDEKHAHRHLKHILDLIDTPHLSDWCKNSITAIFTKIAEAESKIHNVPVEKIHFHEVGAVDSIIDIIGTVWGLEKLGFEKFYSSKLSVGSGSVKCAHGIIPVPAPATLEIIKDFPIIKKDVGTELSTPTGAAVVTTLAEYKAIIPNMTVSAVGYGCGDREFGDMANVFRIISGQCPSSAEKTELQEDTVTLIETNIDDMEQEIFPFVFEELQKNNALDYYITPVVMKKGRPGCLLTVLTHKENINACINVIFKQTTTSGMRINEINRKMLPREIITVDTKWGKVKAKLFSHNGSQKIVPEYEECRIIANEYGIPLVEVMNEIRKTNK